jgi:hypothetical protein
MPHMAKISFYGSLSFGEGGERNLVSKKNKYSCSIKQLEPIF